MKVIEDHITVIVNCSLGGGSHHPGNKEEGAIRPEVTKPGSVSKYLNDNVVTNDKDNN